MSGDRVISQASISRIESSLSGLQQHLAQVDNRCVQLEGGMSEALQEVGAIRTELNVLAFEFRAFVLADRTAKALQRAMTEIIDVRQQLDREFGHHAEVRRRMTGILQATDTGIVRTQTITTVTEELMLAAPGYWLAPCLVALAAWLTDNRDLAERGALEAARRDRQKTTLALALVCRRLGRYSACSAWLTGYFAVLDSSQLPRDTIVMVDAVAGGVFGGDARSNCSRIMEQWIAELGARVGFVEDQREQWRVALLSQTPTAFPDSFHYLPQHSATWPQLSFSLLGSYLHQQLLTYFHAMFEGAIEPTPSLFSAVDQLLDKLVTEYDADELPHRRKERELSLVIETRGDEPAALSRLALEQQALAEQVSFTQLLTNAAMHPETSHASRATQRYAIALSREWIAHAHRDLTATNRASVPLDIQLSVGDWSGNSRDGSDETELLQSLDADLAAREQAALAAVKLAPLDYGAVSVGGLLVLIGLFSGFQIFWIILGAAAIAWFFFQRSQLDHRKQGVRDQFEKLRESSRSALQACLAEIVDWRRAYARADAHAQGFTEFLAAITPEQYALTTHDRGRSVLAKTGGRTLGAN